MSMNNQEESGQGHEASVQEPAAASEHTQVNEQLTQSDQTTVNNANQNDQNEVKNSAAQPTFLIDQLDRDADTIFGVEHERPMQSQNVAGDLMDKLQKMTAEVDKCLRIQDLMKQPYKNRVFAISAAWLERFTMYAQSLQQVHESQAQQIQALTENGCKFSREQQENIEAEFDAVCQVAQSLKPGPVDNFDLIDASDVLMKRREGIVGMQFPGEPDETRNNAMLELFGDWTHMTIKPSVIREAQSIVTQRIERYMAGYTGDTDLHNAGAMFLVDQQCWSKITYTFGLLGPEIMLFAQQDPMLGVHMPDLEPVKVHVHQFDEQLNEIVPPFLGADVDRNGRASLQMLLSSKMTLRQLQNYVSQSVLALSSSVERRSITNVNGQVILLVNPTEKGYNVDCMKELWLQGQYVGQGGAAAGSQGGLNMLNESQDVLARRTLNDLGLRADGDSHLCFIYDYPSLSTCSRPESHRRRGIIFRAIGAQFGVDGDNVFQQQQKSLASQEHNLDAFEMPEEMDFAAQEFAAKLHALDAGYKSDNEGIDDFDAGNFGGYQGGVTSNADQTHFSINMFPTGGQGGLGQGMQGQSSVGGAEGFQSLRKRWNWHQGTRGHVVHQRGGGRGNGGRFDKQVNVDSGAADDVGMFGSGSAPAGMGEVPPEYADDPELWYAMQLSMQDTEGPSTNNQQASAPCSGSPGAADDNPKYEPLDLANRGQQRLQNKPHDIDADIGEVLDAINGEDARLDGDENLIASDALFATNTDPLTYQNGNRHKASDATRTPSTADHGSAKNRSFDLMQGANVEIAANYVNGITGSVTRQADQAGRPAAFDSGERRGGAGSRGQQEPKKSFAEQRSELMAQRRQAMQARFDSAKEKATGLFKQMNVRSGAQPLAIDMLGDKKVGLKKKRMFTESGQEFYQLQPLTRMAPLKTLNIVQSNLNRLAVNISALGVPNAMLKLGQEIEYQDATKPKGAKHRNKKGFATLSDDNEESKGKEGFTSTQRPVGAFGCFEGRKRGRSKHEAVSMGEGMMAGEPAQLSSALLERGLENLTEGNDTDRTDKTQSGGCSQDGGYNERRRRAQNTGVLDDMEEDDEFEALDPKRPVKKTKAGLKALDQAGAAMSDAAVSEDEKIKKTEQTGALHYRDDTLYAVSGAKIETLAQKSSLKKRGTAVVSDLGSATKEPASSSKKGQQEL